MIMLGFAERAQASKAKQSKKTAIRQRGRRDASAIRRKPNRQLLSSKQPMGREGRVSIYPRVGVIFGGYLVLASALRTTGSSSNHPGRGSEPDGHGSRGAAPGVLESELEPFRNRIGMDLGGTRGSGTGTGNF
jgi:hypothetical protein